MTICVALFTGNLDQNIFLSPDVEKKFQLSLGENIYISCQWAIIYFHLTKGENIYFIMPTSITRCSISQWGENIFGPMGLYISKLNQALFTEIIYFRAKGPNEPETVACLTCRVFPTVLMHPYGMRAMLFTLQLCAMARRGVL